jgi:DNA-binding LacI/PurR family transcriptional regulator
MATIREVAKHAGVSIGTVSKVLNGSDERVDPASKERILESIRTLRYKPPPFEKNQKAAIANNIGLIVPHLTEHPLIRQGYVHLLLDGILELAAFRGWSVTIFAQTMWDNVGNAVRRQYDGRCDGLIVVAPQPEHDIVPSLHRRGAPLVQIGSTAWLQGVSSVDIDNHEVGRIIARHFLDLGHKNIGFIAIPREQVSSVERFEGFTEILGEKATRFVVGREEGIEGFAIRFAQLGASRPTAIMTWHDGLAIELIRALREIGLRVPEDVAVASVDDSLDAQSPDMSLTTVPNPLYEIGTRAAAMTIDRVLDHSLPQEIIKLPPRLIVRESSGPSLK